MFQILMVLHYFSMNITEKYHTLEKIMCCNLRLMPSFCANVSNFTSERGTYFKYPSIWLSKRSISTSFFSYSSLPTQGRLDSTAYTYQSDRTCTDTSVSLTITYEHDMLGMLRVMFTCGMSSSCVTLTKFSNIATMDGAAMTWQFTRSQRKRTCSAHYELNTIKTYNKVVMHFLLMLNSTNRA